MLSDKDLPKKWGAKVLSNEGNSLKIRIFTPPKAIVAKWNFHVDAIVKKADEQKVFRYNHHDHIYMLFNPWCSGKMTVFMLPLPPPLITITNNSNLFIHIMHIVRASESRFLNKQSPI